MSGSSPESLDDVYMVRIERDTKGLSDPSKERRIGFMDYLSVRFPATIIVSIELLKFRICETPIFFTACSESNEGD